MCKKSSIIIIIVFVIIITLMIIIISSVIETVTHTTVGIDNCEIIRLKLFRKNLKRTNMEVHDV